MKYPNERFESELCHSVKEGMLDQFFQRNEFANRYNVTRLEAQLTEHNGYSEADIAIIKVNGMNDAAIAIQDFFKELI